MTAEEAAPPTADGPDQPTTTRPWHRALVAVGGAIAIFLLGAAAGLLIGLPGSAPQTPAADSVDVGFAQDMTVHHEQAVLMASWARDHSTDPVVRQLAFDIESTQIAQIGRMQGWLALWGRAPTPTGGYMAWMTGSAADHHGQGTSDGGGVATMPGMATAEELRALRAATGTDLDVLFLQLMLRHHEGGAGMLAYAAEHAGVPDVRNLSAQMLAAQSNEGVYLRQLLAERGAAPLPPP
jgi:uncharacterized protein (DUF305 family)